MQAKLITHLQTAVTHEQSIIVLRNVEFRCATDHVALTFCPQIIDLLSNSLSRHTYVF